MMPRVLYFGRSFASQERGPGRALPYAVELIGFRPPRKGEWYLSGAIVQAYCAPNDLSDAYHVIRRGPLIGAPGSPRLVARRKAKAT